jgi:hypothetical protein
MKGFGLQIRTFIRKGITGLLCPPETEDIYRFLTGEEDTMPEFQYNWTSIP